MSRGHRRFARSALAGTVLLVLAATAPLAVDRPPWSPAETALLRSLWIESLPERPESPSNRYADDPEAAALGKKIFFDTRFSANGEVSCATCHLPDYSFTDRLPTARGVGTVARRSMPLLGMAHQDWFFWDGRKDSLWAQALGPLESPVEHGISRTTCALILYEHYREAYETVFGPMPELDAASCPPLARPDVSDSEAYETWMDLEARKRDRLTEIYVNLGKSVAAYVRTLTPTPSRFDAYVEKLVTTGSAPDGVLSPEEEAGLELFIGKAGCVNCHNGPLLTNGEFHHTVVADSEDQGRAEGILAVTVDEFSCLGEHSDADPRRDCAHVRFMDVGEAHNRGAFKTPTLRNVAVRPPYMHAGQFATLSEVLRAYRAASKRGAESDLTHGELTDEDLEELEAFLGTLTSEIVEVPPS